MQYSLYNNSLKSIARQLRNESTISERILWSRLRKKQIQNVQFYRQVPIGTFIVDFYAKKPRLVIEVDGEYHLTDGMQDKDLNRNHYFFSVGIHLLRFSNKEIEYNINTVVTIINTTILKLITNYPKI